MTDENAKTRDTVHASILAFTLIWEMELAYPGSKIQ